MRPRPCAGCAEKRPRPSPRLVQVHCKRWRPPWSRARTGWASGICSGTRRPKTKGRTCSRSLGPNKTPSCGCLAPWAGRTRCTRRWHLPLRSGADSTQWSILIKPGRFSYSCRSTCNRPSWRNSIWTSHPWAHRRRWVRPPMRVATQRRQPPLPRLSASSSRSAEERVGPGRSWPNCSSWPMQ